MAREHKIDNFDDEPIGLPADDDGLDVSGSIEIPGMKIGDVDEFITDPFTGKKWAVPTGALEENFQHMSPYAIRNKDPNFHYAFYRGAGQYEEVGDMEAEGFVKVTRKETGITRTVLDNDIPAPLDSYHTIGGGDGVQVLMKIPQAIADRRYAANKKFSDSAVAVTQARPNIEPGSGREFTKDSRKAFDKDGSRIA